MDIEKFCDDKLLEIQKRKDAFFELFHAGKSYEKIGYLSYPNNDPCEHCNNNPKNNKFASGVCNCSLPSRNITY